MNSFPVPPVALRCRSDRSFGLSSARVPDMVAHLAANGCVAAGIVDYCGTWAFRAWERECGKAGIRPLYGVELPVLTRIGRPSMWWLARTQRGVQLLYAATTQACARQPMHLTRAEAIELSEQADDIVTFGGTVTDHELLDATRAFPDINERDVAVRLSHLKYAAGSAARGRPAVLTCRNSYVRMEDATTHAHITGGRTVERDGELSCAPDSAGITAMCGDFELPRAPMIKIENDAALLLEEVQRGKELRLATGRIQEWTNEYDERLTKELTLIRDKDFCSYFLIVGELTRWAKEQGIIVGPSRGSSAGSLTCFLLEITEIDPLPPKLIFERFIDVTRKDLPDIDIDFPDTRRAEVIAHLTQKYGAKHVAQIGTISELKPKSALGRLGVATGVPYHVTEQLKQLLADRGAAQAREAMTVQEILCGTELGKRHLAAYPVLRAVANMVGCATHRGKHAAGVIVSPEPVMKYGSLNADGSLQLSKNDAEELGLLKIDVLGLRTLGILQDSGVPLDWYGLPLDDQAALDIYRNARLSGIFQFEGRALQGLTRQMRIENIHHIDAITALARPGPLIGGVTPKYIDRANGREHVEELHPLVREYMEDTYGLPLYQEQTMHIVRRMGNFSWEKTAFVRKAISKRKGEDAFVGIAKDFFAGCAENKIPQSVAESTWNLIKTMAAWQMNKAHTYSYAVLSYWTAYFKAHYPLQFVAAQLRHAKTNESALDILRDAVENDGVQYVPFDIDKSTETWSVQDGVLYGGWEQLHGFGPVLAARCCAARRAGTLTPAQIVKAKSAHNPFANLHPITGEYGHLYRDPVAHGIASDRVWRLVDLVEGELPHGCERVFIARINSKDPGDENEAVRVAKRGYKLTGDTRILTLHMQDDTAQISARVSRFDYTRLGTAIHETVPEGSVVLWRAKFFGGHRFAFITKFKVLRLGGRND